MKSSFDCVLKCTLMVKARYCWGSNNRSLLDPEHRRRKTQWCEAIAREGDGNEDLESTVRSLASQ
jgi:hypothetical protein